MYRLATKRTAKTSRRKREHEFFFRHLTTRVLVYSDLLTVEKSWTLVVTLDGISWVCS